jgi:hypothetical protein
MKEKGLVVHLEVYDPTGVIEVVSQHAPRLADLNGKTIGELSDWIWEDFRTFPAIREELQKRFPAVKIIPYTEFPGLYGNDPEAVAKAIVERGCDAVIVGNAA